MADWLAADWPAPAGVLAGTSWRRDGVSGGPWRSLNVAAHVGDDAAAVGRNRELLRARCALPEEPRWLEQVHGTRVLRLPAERMVTADAAVTAERGVVCAVLTADCLPVVVASRNGAEVGIAHAGWRGLWAGVLENTVSAFDTSPQDLLAWLGPAISQPAFEVGDDVRNAFLAAGADAERFFVRNGRGRWQADLYGLASARLRALGVTRIYGGDRCTYQESGDFYSYRRDGQCGRMATFVYRR